VTKVSAIILAALLWAGTAASVQAACEPDLTRVRAPLNERYDSFDPRPGVHDLDVVIRNRSDERCDLTLTLVSDVEGRRFFRGPGRNDVLGYEILSSSGQVLVNEDNRNFGLPVSIAPRSEFNASLQIRIPSGQVLSSGYYFDFIGVTLADATDRVVDRRRNTPLGVWVEPRAQVNIAGASGSFDAGVRRASLDFGTLTTGVERRAFIQVRANGSARINISSANRGNLRQDGTAQGIPYLLTIDGTPIALDRGQSSLSRRPAKTLDGTAYEMIATVPRVPDIFAGQYSDIVTIDVEARH